MFVLFENFEFLVGVCVYFDECVGECVFWVFYMFLGSLGEF